MLRYHRDSLTLNLAVGATVVVALTAWFGNARVERDHRALLEGTLVTVLDATSQAVRTWSARERAEATLRAASPEVRDLAAGLSRAGRSPVALVARSRMALGRRLTPALAAPGHDDFALIGRDSVTLVTASGDGVGRKHALAGVAGALDSLWAGGTFVSLPLADSTSTSARRLPAMYAAAPVLGASGRVIAALAFRMDPAQEFTKLFERHDAGLTARTYAFDGQGRLASASPFEAQLRAAGLLGPRESSILRVEVRDPGPDPIAGRHDSRPAGRRPLTRMAAAAVGGRDGVDSRGYRDYRGVTVVGAWKWEPSLGLGIAAEIDAKQAYGTLVSIRWIVAGLTALAMSLVLGVLALRRRSHHLENLIASIPLGMIVSDAAGIILHANATACEVFGYEESELFRRKIEILLPEALRGAHVEHRASFQREPRVRRMGSKLDLPGRRKDGSPVLLDVVLAPLQVEGNRYVLAVLWDIGTRVALEQALRERTEELTRSNSDLEQFAYVASHDLRAPLRGIEQLTIWLAEDLAAHASPESKQHLDLLRKRVLRLEALLGSLLEYARVSRAAGPVVRVDVARLIRDVAALQDWPPGFVLRITGPMPTFETDATGLQQVFMNLLGNAIKHHDRVAGVIEVGAGVPGKFREFFVTDDGPGIPPTLHAKAFEMFQTLKPRDEVEGSGMGLALVKRIVERRGGAVAIESGTARGTTIRFTWPGTGKGGPRT